MPFIFDIKRYAIHDGPGIRTTLFLKGCPLRCVWCHNPESWSPSPRKLYKKGKCIGCRTCVEICPHHALELTPEGIRTDESLCTLCGACTRECPSGALEMSGREWSIDEILEELGKERSLMERSGGGVTICGGEPLMHPSFLLELLDELGSNGYHRAVDTSLYASEESVRKVAERCELMLVDLKMMDSALHERFTGVPNGPILDNIRLISSLGSRFFIRIPLIDGVNSDPENIGESARFLASLPNRPEEVDLLPYHDIGKGKHERMGTVYNPEGIPMAVPSKEVQERCIGIFTSLGLKAQIGG